MCTRLVDRATLSVRYLNHRSWRWGIPGAEFAGGIVSRGWTQLAIRAWQALRRAYVRRQTVQALSALDNRALADIGISRGQIPAIALATADDLELRPGPQGTVSADGWQRRHAIEAPAAATAARP